MRTKVLNFLRVHPKILNMFWKVAHVFFSFVGFFVPIRNNTMLITSFAGRKFDDSPKAIYDEVISRKEFLEWELIWAFVEPDKFDIPRGRKIKIDTFQFFAALLYSKVWVSNSGMDRNIDINRKKTVKVETWHGTPLKKIGEDQNSGVLGNYEEHGPVDKRTIRCAQSDFDRDIFVRVFNADKNCFLMCDLPRNDGLLRYCPDDIRRIKESLGIPYAKKVLLYMPTYREFLIDEHNQTYIAPPIDLNRWRKELGQEYILLFRAHYAICASLNIIKNEFVIDVSDYPLINDLYAIADILISDYSSAYFDYSILDKPMLCFAYDKDEYMERRGLYLDLNEALPCPIDSDESSLIMHIKNMDYEKSAKDARSFHLKYAPYAGNASKTVVDELIRKLETGKE